MRVGMYQFQVTGNIEDNKEKIVTAINDAHKEKIKLLIFPECALTGYPPRNIENSSKVNFNELEDVYVLLQKLCDDYEMNVVVGTITKVDNTFYNSAILFSPRMERIIYNKKALWGWDRDNFSCGSENCIVQIEDWKIGIRICFEVRFPEFFRELYKAQTDLNVIIFYDVSDVDDVSRYEMIKAHILTRAVENVTYTATVNAIAPFQTAPTLLYDKSGRLLCEAERNKEQLLVYDLEKSENNFGENGRKEISNWLLFRE